MPHQKGKKRLPDQMLLAPVLIAAAFHAPSLRAQDPPVQPQQNDAATATGEPGATGESSADRLVQFQADALDYDYDRDIVTASGHVHMSRQGYELYADKVVWDRKTGQVVASGNVRATGPDRETAYSESVELTDTMRDGVVENLLLVLEGGARLAARSGKRAGDVYTLDKAAFTPCAVEDEKGCPKDPTWQIRADRVVYDAARKRVRYRGARIELFGLPLLPLPGLAHPVGQEASNGLLVPDIRFSSLNGVEYVQPYYFRLSPNRDLKVTGHVFSGEMPMLSGQYRALTTDGAYQVKGYLTYSRRFNPGSNIMRGNYLDGNFTDGEHALRGYFESSGRFQLDPSWSITHSLRRASDRTFLRRYDISNEDRLRSTFAVERIDESSYFSLSGWSIQTLRIGVDQGQIPIALPEIDYRKRINEPLLGGIVQLQANSLALTRSQGQDTQRAFASARWDLRKLTNWGQVVNFTLFGRGDVYHSGQNAQTLTEQYRGDSGWRGRGIFAAAVDVKWPFAGEALGGVQTLTPRIQLVAAPTIANLRIPNEDARAVDLEDSNLFALNRFPGYDRFEDNYRFTYGLDWSLRRNDFTVDANIGQSVRLNNRASLFPDGTGLSERISDFVGRADVKFKELVRLSYRFRLDKDNLAVRRNEIDATVGTRNTYATVGYLKLNRDIGETLEDLQDREEIRLSGRVAINRNWSVYGSTIVDLTSTNEEPTSITDGYDPVRHRLGVAYENECLSVGFSWERDYGPAGDARSGNNFLFRLSLKQLGV